MDGGAEKRQTYTPQNPFLAGRYHGAAVAAAVHATPVVTAVAVQPIDVPAYVSPAPPQRQQAPWLADLMRAQRLAFLDAERASADRQQLHQQRVEHDARFDVINSPAAATPPGSRPVVTASMVFAELDASADAASTEVPMAVVSLADDSRFQAPMEQPATPPRASLPTAAPRSPQQVLSASDALRNAMALLDRFPAHEPVPTLPVGTVPEAIPFASLDVSAATVEADVVQTVPCVMQMQPVPAPNDSTSVVLRLLGPSTAVTPAPAAPISVGNISARSTATTTASGRHRRVLLAGPTHSAAPSVVTTAAPTPREIEASVTRPVAVPASVAAALSAMNRCAGRRVLLPASDASAAPQQLTSAALAVRDVATIEAAAPRCVVDAVPLIAAIPIMAAPAVVAVPNTVVSPVPTAAASHALPPTAPTAYSAAEQHAEEAAILEVFRRAGQTLSPPRNEATPASTATAATANEADIEIVTVGAVDASRDTAADEEEEDHHPHRHGARRQFDPPHGHHHHPPRTEATAGLPSFMLPTSSWLSHVDPTPRHIRTDDSDDDVGSNEAPHHEHCHHDHELAQHGVSRSQQQPRRGGGCDDDDDDGEGGERGEAEVDGRVEDGEHQPSHRPAWNARFATQRTPSPSSSAAAQRRRASTSPKRREPHPRPALHRMDIRKSRPPRAVLYGAAGKGPAWAQRRNEKHQDDDVDAAVEVFNRHAAQLQRRLAGPTDKQLRARDLKHTRDRVGLI
jgi:hypothetical protein